MIALIISLIAMFIWLLKETDWLRVNLMPKPVKPKLIYHKFEPMLCRRCNNYSYFKGAKRSYTLPAKTVHAFGSTMNFQAGCNRCRAELLRKVAKAQKSHAIPHYAPFKSYCRISNKLKIEILVDGQLQASFNGDYKRGTIKTFMRQYCYPGEGKIRLVKI